MSFEEAKQFLQNENDGVSLYDHLSEVILKILVERPPNATEVFEHLSSAIKSKSFAPPQPSDIVDGDNRKIVKASRNAQLAYAKRCAEKLLSAPDDGGPDIGSFPSYPDLLDDLRLLEWAGVGFGNSMAFRLYLSVKKLAESLSEDYESLRFWGKLTGRDNDYWIVEGQNNDEAGTGVQPGALGVSAGIDTEALEGLVEGREGVNKFCYWVTTSPDLPFVKLPDVTPAQVIASRGLRRFLTGSLDADVKGYPPFPGGKESGYLRALISRITASTSVSPNGFFEIDEDSEIPTLKPVEAEVLQESFPKSADELKDLDSWVHHEMELNTLGRVRPLPEREDEDGNPIEDEEQPEEVPPLRELSADDEGAWSIRTCPGGGGAGAGAGANSGGGGSGTVVAVARSLVWPGAYTVTSGRRFINVYIGDGSKSVTIKDRVASTAPAQAAAIALKLEGKAPIGGLTPSTLLSVSEGDGGNIDLDGSKSVVNRKLATFGRLPPPLPKRIQKEYRHNVGEDEEEDEEGALEAPVVAPTATDPVDGEGGAKAGKVKGLLLEQADVLVDPTPPEEEGEEDDDY